MDREHRQTSANKRTYSTMAEPRREDVRPSFHSYSHVSRAPPDDHYNNEEHRSQRRRIEIPDPVRPHFPGDGYDFRRPVMSGSSAGDSRAGIHAGERDHEDAIDLTSDGFEHAMPLPLPHLALPRNPAAPPASGQSAASHAQRLPRFERDIIDLADSDEDDHQPQQPQNLPAPAQMDDELDGDSLFIPEAPPRRTTAGLRRPGFMRQLSPAMDLDDIEVVGSRPLSRSHSRRVTPANGPNRNASPHVEVNAPIDLTADDDDDDDDVIHTDTRALPGINGDRPAMAGSGIGVRDQPAFNMGLGRLVNRLREARPGFAGVTFGQYFNGAEGEAEARAQHQRTTRDRANAARDNVQNLEARLNRAHAQNVGLFGDGARPPPPRPRHLPNIMMDYNVVGFDLGFGIVPNRPPTPKYEPPPPVENGFTRSPGEDEEVVCPNCGDELAVGKGETKQQVYVVKTCGHAYCGECATREKSNKKGKSRATDENSPPPLKKCVVVGCGKSASKSQMIHVFMSS